MDNRRDIQIPWQLAYHSFDRLRGRRRDVPQVFVLDRVLFRRPGSFHDRGGNDLVAGPARYLRREVQGRSALTARAESGDDRHSAGSAFPTGVDTTCVTGTLCSARARSTTSKRCQTDSSGGSVEITI